MSVSTSGELDTVAAIINSATEGSVESGVRRVLRAEHEDEDQ